MVTTPNVRAKFAVVLNPNLILKHSQTAGMLIAPLMRKNRISIKKNHNMRLTFGIEPSHSEFYDRVFAVCQVKT